MTAEVAIINASAVAIAADSAVTIGSGKKIYNSALKVFALSKVAPVGIMVYGNAGFLGVPWETLIKIYRENLKQKRFNTLEEYANDFLSYLSNRPSFFPKSIQDSWIISNIRGYYQLIRQELFSEADQVLREKGQISDNETADILKSIVHKHHENLIKIDFAIGFEQEAEEKIKNTHTENSAQISDEIFQGVKITSSTREKLKEISAFLHTRKIFSESKSGVVFSGFGENDLYPVVCTYEVEGIIEGKLKYDQLGKKSVRVEKTTDCYIIPFAQDDMVTSFMEGMNPAVARFIVQYLNQLIGRFPELIEDSSLIGSDVQKKAIRKEIQDKVEGFIENFFNQLNHHKQNEHITPILTMVNVLPKDELAAMAESLVNLTAFKRRMTEQLETVGGPIDVAVISKGDGLVWVKRKHYFPPELNQHFFANYYRGVTDEFETEK